MFSSFSSRKVLFSGCLAFQPASSELQHTSNLSINQNSSSLNTLYNLQLLFGNRLCDQKA